MVKKTSAAITRSVDAIKAKSKKAPLDPVIAVRYEINRLLSAMYYSGNWTLHHIKDDDTEEEALRKVLANMEQMGAQFKSLGEDARDASNKLEEHDAMVRGLGALFGQVMQHVPKD